MLTNKIPSPILLFSIGFSYYLISPIILYLGLSNGFDFPILAEALPYLDNNFFNVYYILDLFYIAISFYIGYKFSLINVKYNLKKVFNLSITKYVFGKKIIILFDLILLIPILYFSLKDDVFLFSGYREQINVTFLGTLGTLFFINIFLLLFYSKSSETLVFKLILFICGFILLSFGSRNMVLCGFISLLFNYLANNKIKYQNFKLGLIFLLSLFFVTCISIWRSGYEFSLEALFSHLFADTFYVISSAGCYLSNLGSRPLFEVPYSLFAGVINFLPSVFFPEKGEWIAAIVFDENYCSPYGASSIIMTMYSNFGSFYGIFIAILAYFFTTIYIKSKESIFFYSIYLSISPFLIFHVFNQPLYGLIKLVVYNGIIIPFIIYLFLQVVKKYFGDIYQFSKKIKD